MIFDTRQIVKNKGDISKIIKERLEKDFNEHKYVYHNKYPKLMDEKLPQAALDSPYSLMIIKPDSLRFRKINDSKLLADSYWKGLRYNDFRVTDSQFINRLRSKEPINNSFQLDCDVYLIISLADVYINPGTGAREYYKLVAAVVECAAVEKIPYASTKDENSYSESMDDEGIKVSASSITEEEKLNAIELLINGIDPYTGEVLEKEHIVNSDLVNSILLTAKKAIVQRKEREKKKKASSGARWTKDEDDRLIEEYRRGLSIKEIAEIHKRSSGAIQSRLLKLSLIELPHT